MTEATDATNLEVTETMAAPPPPQEIFHLELHAWIEAQQTSHGVRHDDYAQYHGYCTRRLSRLSHLKEAKKWLVSSTKFATIKPSSETKRGGRHAHCSRVPDTLGSDVTHVPHINVLWYLLVLGERSWAHANQLSKQHSKRQHVLTKLKRATQWSQLLLAKARVAGDASTVQECEAYASWMKANYALEKYDYLTASHEYANAMTLCHKLSQDTADITDPTKQLERQDLFVTRADTLMRPLFRYCQYELKQAGVVEPHLWAEEPRLMSKTDPQGTASKQEDSKGEDFSIVFRGKDLTLESKELRVVMLKLQSLQQERGSSTSAGATTPSEESKLGGEGGETMDETSFLTILSVLDDALEIVQGQLSTLDQASSGPAVQAKRQQYLLWKGYLQWQKTQRVMDHTAGLLQSVTGHAERVHIYDALLQHAKSLLQLPRPEDNDNGRAGGAEEDDEFALQAQANVLRLQALKTYHMAWYYYQELSNCKAGWALLEQSIQLCKRAKEEIAACDDDMPHAEDYLQELDALPTASAKAAMQSAWYLEQGGLSGGTGGSRRSKKATKRPLLLRLMDQDAGMVLAGELEPIPIPCKPVFYDLALEYALDTTKSLDPIESFLNEHTVKEEPEPSPSSGGKGLFGWLTG